MADAERRELVRDLGALRRGRRLEPLAQPRARGVDAELPPGLGIDEAELAHVRQRLLARVADLDGEHVMAAGELEQRQAPVARPAKVGDDGDERALPRHPGDEPERRSERRGPASFEHGLAPQREQEAQHPGAARAWRDDLRPVVAEADETEPVAPPACEMAERERHALRHVGLPSLGRSERHRGRDVECEPRHEHALGEVDANVRLAGPRGHVPFDPAHVVAGDVRPHLGELAARAEHRRAVVAGEHPFDPPPDRQVERPQQRLRERARPRPVRPAGELGRLGSDRQAAVTRLLRSSSGAITFSITASRILSASTCSARAW